MHLWQKTDLVIIELNHLLQFFQFIRQRSLGWIGVCQLFLGAAEHVHLLLHPAPPLVPHLVRKVRLPDPVGATHERLLRRHVLLQLQQRVTLSIVQLQKQNGIFIESFLKFLLSQGTSTVQLVQSFKRYSQNYVINHL